MDIFKGLSDFFESIVKYVSKQSTMFLIFLGAFLIVSVVIIIITSFAYECQLTKTIDKINKFLERNPRINDDNLVAFNNLMKASSVPKTLRRQWQQFMLYREHPASYYMSFQHCVENPMRNSTYRQQMTIYKVISYVLVVLSLVISTFMTTSAYAVSGLSEIVIMPMTILVLYWLVSMVLDLIHSAISGDLFQNYQYFEINMDKAMLTLPEFVDYEVLFSQDEIRRGIPVLFAYLQKRAIQEQQELEKARLKSSDHEKFDFDKAGLDGSLVLDRAMRETENFTNQRKKYMQEIDRVNNEIATIENNYKEQVKEYQRQVQTSKETVENLKEQLEQASSTIEINYIKKQMRDEINRQQSSEKDFDILTDKHNQEVKSLNQEIKHYEEETKNAKEALEAAMLSEFNTYSVKVYDNLEKIVDEKMQNKVEDYKDQIKGLEGQLEEKNEELENVYTRYQEALSQVPAEPQSETEPVYTEIPAKKGKKKKKNSNDDAGMVQPEQVDEYAQPEYVAEDYNQESYDDYSAQDQNYDNSQDYAYDNNQDYNYDDSQNYEYDNSQTETDEQYVPLNEDQNIGDYNYTDANEQYVPTNDSVADDMPYVPMDNDEYTDSGETYIPLNDYPIQEESNGEEYVPLSEETTESTGSLNDEYIANVDQENKSNDDILNSDYIVEDEGFNDSDFDIDFNKNDDNKTDLDDMSFDFGDDNKKEQESKESIEEPVDEPEIIEEEVDEGDFDLNKILGLYDNDSSKSETTNVSNEETNLPNEESSINDETNEDKGEDESNDELPAPEAPKRKAGRPRKNVDESEIKPKRSVGRPRKVVDEEEIKPKRSVGRPKKVVETETLEKPKKKVGRPRKQNNEVVEKRKAGRPRKNVDETEIKSKRRVGRPKKSTEDTITLEKPMKKVGRPRKKDNQIPTKRRVGRPRKIKQVGKTGRKVGRPRKAK